MKKKKEIIKVNIKNFILQQQQRQTEQKEIKLDQ